MTPKQLVSVIESALLGPLPPSPSQKVELFHAIRNSLPSLQSLLSYRPPNTSDRAKVQSKEVGLPNVPPLFLDDQDVQIALKLSDDLHLNEIDCAQLIVYANQKWGLMGREPLEILRLATGLWYTERRDLLTALYTLLRAVVLDQGLEADVASDIQKYLENLINNGLRQRLIFLIKELSREEPAGMGGPHSERYVLDSRSALVARKAVVSRERLILGHCLVLSSLVVPTSPKDVGDIFLILKDSASELGGANNTIKRQITFSLLFSLVIAIVSDALSAAPDKASVLSRDASFRHDFHEIVMAAGNDPNVEGFVGSIRLAWAVHLMLIQDALTGRDTISSASSSSLGYLQSCLEVIFSKNVFQFILDEVLQTAAYENDDEGMSYMYNAYLHKMMTCFFSHPLARDKVKEWRVMSMSSPYHLAGSHDSNQTLQVSETDPLPFVSLLEFLSRIYQKEPELLSGNDDLWKFVNYVGEDLTNCQTLVAFLNMLSSLASNQEGASKVFALLQGKVLRSVGWSNIFDRLSIYNEKLKESFESAGAMLPELPEGDAKVLVSYFNVRQKIVENGNPHVRSAQPMTTQAGHSRHWSTRPTSLLCGVEWESAVPDLESPAPDAEPISVEGFPVEATEVSPFLRFSLIRAAAVGVFQTPRMVRLGRMWFMYILLQIVMACMELLLEEVLEVVSSWPPNINKFFVTLISFAFILCLGLYLAVRIYMAREDLGSEAAIIELGLAAVNMFSLSIRSLWVLRFFRFTLRLVFAVAFPICWQYF